MRLIIGTWFWGEKYPPFYVERLANGIRRHLKSRYEFRVFRPVPKDGPLLPGCMVRLKMFDPKWQIAQGITADSRMVCIDLDAVITGPLDPLFDREDAFTILQGVNAANPCPYNGSLWMLRAGFRPDVWADFSLEKASRVPFYNFPDDQAWLAHKLPGAAAYGPADGVYGFRKPGWMTGDKLPDNARLVTFFGSRDPAQFLHLPWVRKNWA